MADTRTEQPATTPEEAAVELENAPVTEHDPGQFDEAAIQDDEIPEGDDEKTASEPPASEDPEVDEPSGGEEMEDEDLGD